MQVKRLSTHVQVRRSLNGHLRHISCLDSLAVTLQEDAKDGIKCLG